MTESHIRNVIEAALLAAGKPLQAAELVDLFNDSEARPTLTDARATLAALAEEYSSRGIEIKETAAGFRIQVRRELANEISRLWPERPAKYSRALLETLALIAYRQPITRGEIEAVRGVAVNPNILKTVIERNWVRVVGHRDVPGRPELLGTTRDFLDYFGLRSLDELPALAELKAIGEIKVQFDLPDPGQLAQLGSDGGAADNSAASSDVVESGDGSAAAAGPDANGELVAADEMSGTAVASPDASGESVGTGEVSDAAVAGADASGETASVQATSSEVAGVNASGEFAPHEDIAARGDIAARKVAAAHEGAAAGEGAAAHERATDRQGAAKHGVVTATAITESGSSDANRTNVSSPSASKPTGRSPGRKKQRGKSRTSDTALHEAEEFAASVDADLAAGDDDSSDEDELSAAGPDSSELVAGPRDIDD